jgi:hypothetical protein
MLSCMNLDEASSTALQKNMILATTKAEIRSSHHLQIGYVLHIGYKARIKSKKVYVDTGDKQGSLICKWGITAGPT